MKKKLFLAFLGLILIAQFAQSDPSRHEARKVPGDFLLFRLERLGKELNLNTDQQSKLDALKREMRSLVEQRMERRQNSRKNIESELTKAKPDLDQISAMMHAQIDENAGFRHTMLTRVSNFCNELSPDQKKILYDRILGKIEEREED